MMDESNEDNSCERDKLNNPNIDHFEVETTPTFPKPTLRITITDAFHVTCNRVRLLIDEKYLNIIFFLSFLVLFLILMNVILSVYFGLKIHHFPIKCETQDCISASLTIISSVNLSHNPCESFWKYACEGWIKNHPVPKGKKSFSIEDSIQKSIMLKFFHLISDSNLNDSSNSFVSKINTFYKSCLQENSDEDVYKFFMNEITERFGEFYFNLDSKANVNYQTLIRRLLIFYEISVFFKIEIGSNDYANDTAVIKVVPAFPGLSSNVYYNDKSYSHIIEAYSNYIKKMLVEFRVPSGIADKFEHSTIVFEKNAIKCWDEHVSQPYEPASSTVQQLDEVIPWFSWQPFFAEYYAPEVITNYTRLIYYFPRYFSCIAKVVKESDSNFLNRYIVWQFLKTYLPLASQKYQDITNNFLKKLEGLSCYETFPLSRHEFCLKLSMKYFAEVHTALLLRDENVSNKINASINLAKNVQQVMIDKVDSFPWLLNTSDKEKTKAKIKNVKFVFNLTGNLWSESQLFNFYNNLSISPGSFLNNFKTLASFFRKRKLHLIKYDVPFVDISPYQVKLEYKFIENSIFQNFGLFNNPIFRPGYPLAMIYGSYGFRIASALLESVNLIGLRYDSLGIIDTYYTNQEKFVTRKSYENLKVFIQCLMNEILSNSSSKDYKHFNAFNLESKTFADILGLEIAFEAYKHVTNKFGKQKLLPGLSIPQDQLFFLSFAQSFCQSTRQVNFENIGNELKELPFKEKVETLIKYSPGFLQTFNCNSHKSFSTICPFI